MNKKVIGEEALEPAWLGPRKFGLGRLGRKALVAQTVPGYCGTDSLRCFVQVMKITKISTSRQRHEESVKYRKPNDDTEFSLILSLANRQAGRPAQHSGLTSTVTPSSIRSLFPKAIRSNVHHLQILALALKLTRVTHIPNAELSDLKSVKTIVHGDKTESIKILYTSSTKDV